MENPITIRGVPLSKKYTFATGAIASAILAYETGGIWLSGAVLAFAACYVISQAWVDTQLEKGEAALSVAEVEAASWDWIDEDAPNHEPWSEQERERARAEPLPSPTITPPTHWPPPGGLTAPGAETLRK